MQYKITLQGKQELGRWFAAKPGQIKRATRFAINEYTRILTKEIGSKVPRSVSSSVAGYKRVRMNRTPAKARAKRMQGITWVGENQIAGIYAKGKLKVHSDGVSKGIYFFENAFVATMKSGHQGIFYRKGNKIKEATFTIEADAKGDVRDVIGSTEPKIRRILQNKLKRELSRKK